MAKKTAKKTTRKKAAKKKVAKKKATKKRRGRPTDVDLIKNLEARIQEVKDRMAKRTQKDIKHVKSSTRALRAINTAMGAAKKAGDNHLRHALADSFRVIAKHYKKNGYKTPKASLPRGRKPK